MVIPTTESTLRITLIRLSEEKLKLIEVTRERDEARGQVDALVDRLGKTQERMIDAERELAEARAEMIRWMSIAEGRGRTDDDDTGKAIAKLIRQRDEAREALKTGGMFDIIDRAAHDRAAAIRERDEVWKKYDLEAVENMLAVNKIRHERDEARGQVENQKERIGEFFAALEKLISELDEARESLEFQKKLNVELNKRESQTYQELIAVTEQRDEARGQRDRLAEALKQCREDSVELLDERDWWQNETRFDYQKRYCVTRDNIDRADAALQSLTPNELSNQ